MKRIDKILTQCIDDIKAGRVSLEDCLDRYPDIRHELKPLLKVALSIEAPPDIHPSDAFKVRTRVNLMEYTHASQEARRAKKSLARNGIRHGWFNGWARAATIMIAAILVISAAGTGTALASQSSLPGDTLYIIKLGTEQLQRIITFDDATEVELELKFAGIRLDELEELTRIPADQTTMTTGSSERILAMSVFNIFTDYPKTNTTHSEWIAKAVTGYEKNLNQAIIKAEKVLDNENSIEKVALAILGHFVRIDKIEDGAAEGTREAILNIKEVMISGHIRILQDLAKVDPVRATEINLQAIQGRLDRAETEAARGNNKRVEDALQDYERLRRCGEEISDSAGTRGQDTIPVDEMNALATPGQLESLGYIYGQVSQETKIVVEQSMVVAVEAYGQDVQALQQQGAQGDIPTEPSLPDDIPDDVKKQLQGGESQGGSGNGGRR